jgi:hypothetical protein
MVHFYYTPQDVQGSLEQDNVHQKTSKGCPEPEAVRALSLSQMDG